MTKRFLALDLGTTTLAGALLTPQGEVAAQAFLPNPQVREGKDVMTRLQAAVAGRGEELRRLLAAGVNELTARLLERTGMAPETIVAAAAAGATVLVASHDQDRASVIATRTVHLDGGAVASGEPGSGA